MKTGLPGTANAAAKQCRRADRQQTERARLGHRAQFPQGVILDGQDLRTRQRRSDGGRHANVPKPDVEIDAVDLPVAVEIPSATYIAIPCPMLRRLAAHLIVLAASRALLSTGNK